MTSKADNPLGYTGVGFPDVFTTMPTQPTEKKPGQLPPEKIKEYFENGFLVVENFFTAEEMAEYRRGCEIALDNIAQKLHQAGRLADLHEGLGLEERLLALEKEYPGMAVLIHKSPECPQPVRGLQSNDRLLNVMEQLLGPDLGASPIWAYRAKVPRHEQTHVPWHQDSAYFDEASYSTLVATAWTAITDATRENGCLQFCKGGHKKGMVLKHECCENFYLMLKEEEMVKTLGVDPEKDFVLAEMKSGGVVFFSNMIPHRSVPNVSNRIRWGLDVRFQSPEKPWGFHGMKDGILVRSPNKPEHVPDWDFYYGQDRYVEQKKYEIAKTGEGKVEEFDAIITGPWMDRWHITQHSVNVDQFLGEKAKKAAAVADQPVKTIQ